MIGNNTLTLNQATINEAVEAYLKQMVYPKYQVIEVLEITEVEPGLFAVEIKGRTKPR